MAKASASSRLYGKPPRIEAPPAQGDTDQSGHEEEAEDTAAETAGEPETEATMDKGGNTEGEVMAGTNGIPTHHHQHSTERTEMHHRHMAEHHAMHHRHEQEHLMRVMGHHHEGYEEMHDRHEEEKKALHRRHEKEHREMHERHEESASDNGPSGGMKDKDLGNRGTQPKKD